MAAMRAAILAAKDSAPIFGPDHPNPNKQLPSLTDEVRARRPPASNYRFPLQPRDKNAKMRAPLKASTITKGADRKMGQYDKQNQNSEKFTTSNLSRSSKALNNRAPLTPRIASSVSINGTSPFTRRALSPAISVQSRDDSRSTPVSAFLNNVTPRSESRKSRVNSTSSSPLTIYNDVSNPARDNVFVPSQSIDVGSDLENMGSEREFIRRPTVSFSHSFDNGDKKKSTDIEKDSKFFFANEVKSTVSDSRSQIPKKNSPTLLYSNQDSRKISHSKYPSGSSVGSMANEEKTYPIFYHANGTPDLSFSSTNQFTPSRPSSAHSSSSRATNSKTLGKQSPLTLFPTTQPRSTSPSKLNQYVSSPPHLTHDQHSQLNSSLKGELASESTTFQGASLFSSKSSAATPRGPLHFNEKSINSSISKSSDKARPVDTMSSLSNLTSSSFSTPESIISSQTMSESQIPVEAGDKLQQLNELAANARRERKVLDLEITNSSLAAINRTLEREMRKQTAELRRYRRLSRSGRLSIVKFPTNNIPTNGDDDKLLTSELSANEDEDSEIDYVDESSEDENSDSSSHGSRTVSKSDLWHRKRDEKRLQLDLAKHQKLLASSQEVNLSIIRCLGMTEDLIKEGLKALQYKVAVSDVELGGRVLTPDEKEDIDNEGMSEVGFQILKEVRYSAMNGKLGFSSNSTKKMQK
ncbi:hypothetical protein OnM2_082012 [Erysiphe neolycopersici]|uniref:Uncharacterized protein n=1 Tax=Erysiphe neolycopersici TaxID=212602 RepID=A0A420HFK4_9PEZI|nr:hypothetical protein OnM2_082012 [Erysiphe neolycopersici]